MNSTTSPFNRFLICLIGAVAVVALLAGGCGPGDDGAEEAGEAAEETPAATDQQAEAGGRTEVGAGKEAIGELQQGDATITGTVTYVGQVPNFQPIDMNADPECAAKHDQPVMPQTLVLGDGNTTGNVFVQVKDGFAQEDFSAPSTAVVIDQEGCMYHPHVVGVMVDQPLEFWNSDQLLHNVHGTPDKNREFNLGMPASLEQKSVTLNTPEEYVPVKCDVHPWMSAYVAVMTHPYFDVTEEDGQFEITVPAGTYTVEAWHERLGTQTQEVTVAAGETAEVAFELDVPQQ